MVQLVGRLSKFGERHFTDKLKTSQDGSDELAYFPLQ